MDKVKNFFCAKQKNFYFYGSRIIKIYYFYKIFFCIEYGENDEYFIVKKYYKFLLIQNISYLFFDALILKNYFFFIFFPKEQ